MDTVRTTRSEQPLLNDLKSQVAQVATLLGEPVDNIAVLALDHWPGDYMRTSCRDRVISLLGPTEGVPFIHINRSHFEGWYVGIGIELYQCSEPDLRYAITIMKGRSGHEWFFMAPKNKIYRLKRYAHRKNREANQKTNPPILADGLLEDVVRNTIGFLLKAKEIKKYGVRIKRGVILDGPPGNGKTMACRYIRELCSQNAISYGTVSSAEIDDAYEHKKLNELLSSNTVMFFDDIDVSYMDRGKGNGKMACSLLTAMDGMRDEGHLVRIFTTNEPVSILDKAFTRPGRIDKCITFAKPDGRLRRRLIEKLWPKEIRDAINVDYLVNNLSVDLSFAELEAIRTALVTNKVLGDGTWNLHKAFEDFECQRAENARQESETEAGFHKERRRK